VSRLTVALAFLTRLPLTMPPETGAREVGRAMLLFPIVGGAVGAILAAAGLLLARVLPAPLAAVLVVALATLATGALHLDGLADTADGLGGGRDREHALGIMRDHAVGAYGAAALVLALLVKAAAVAALLGRPGAIAWLPVAGALGRWVMVPLAGFAPRARAGGLGASVAAHVGSVEVAGATALAWTVAVVLAGAPGAAAGAAVALLGIAFAALCRRRIGGMTGDTLGAAGELAEALVLVVGAGLGAS
jgi:adenosylcobinamide-GDP ribazoletransferase